MGSDDWSGLIAYLVPTLCLVLSIPLIAKIVPPNGFYGYRTPRTLRSPEVWYAANFNLGVAMVASSIIAGIVVWFVSAAESGASTGGPPIALLVGLGITTIGIIIGAIWPH